MKIYIPSCGRADKQTTVAHLPLSLREVTTVVVPFIEIKDYELALAGAGVKVACPTIPAGIGHCRQWIVEQEDKKVIMLDDDLVFATRRQDEPTKFYDATDDEVEELFASVWVYLDSYAHVGVATREGGNRCTDALMFNTRLLRFLAYRCDVLREEGIGFTETRVMEDFAVALNLLVRGYESIKINDMVQNQNGSGLAGGCSMYRTEGVQAEAAHQMAEMFPGLVRVSKKITKTAWGGGERVDVTIYWKKALSKAPMLRTL